MYLYLQKSYSIYCNKIFEEHRLIISFIAHIFFRHFNNSFKISSFIIDDHCLAMTRSIHGRCIKTSITGSESYYSNYHDLREFHQESSDSNPAPSAHARRLRDRGKWKSTTDLRYSDPVRGDLQSIFNASRSVKFF